MLWYARRYLSGTLGGFYAGVHRVVGNPTTPQHPPLITLNTTKQMKQSKINKKLFSIMIDTLKKLRTVQPGEHLPLMEIRMHLVDDEGDGVGVWVEYNKETGEFNKGMLPLDGLHREAAMEQMESASEDYLDEIHSEVVKSKGLLN